MEFPHVAIVGMVEGAIPSHRAEEIEEERRLCYVGVTRAQDRLVLLSSERDYRNWEVDPSRFLDEMYVL